MVLKGPVSFSQVVLNSLTQPPAFGTPLIKGGWGGQGEGETHLFCWERGEREKIAEVLQKKISLPVSIWVGPKGGWTDEEVGLAKKMNFHLVEIAPLILRGELAALHAVSTALAFIK